MTHILIVGGAGFIGAQTAELLHQAGYHTTIFDNLSQGNEKSVLHGHFIQGDIGHLQELEDLFQKNNFDAVIHFAALTDVGESQKIPLTYYQHNFSYTLNLLKAMLRHRVKYFVFSSTAAIFGLPQAPIGIQEDHPTLPINAYGESKLMVEKVLKRLDESDGLRFCTLRYFNAAGGDPKGLIKNFKKKENNLIPLILKTIKHNTREQKHDPITIFGTDYPTPDGTCIRDYIHVADLASAHLLALEQLLNGFPSSSYNLGNGQGFSVKEVIHSVENFLNTSIPLLFGPRRAGDPPILKANPAKAQLELKWSPQFPHLKQMIEHAWQAIP